MNSTRLYSLMNLEGQPGQEMENDVCLLLISFDFHPVESVIFHISVTIYEGHQEESPLSRDFWNVIFLELQVEDN